MGKRRYTLDTAQEALAAIEDLLGPLCDRLQTVGSVRRERPLVHDIDLLVQPKAGVDLDNELAELSFNELLHIRDLEPRTKRFIHLESGIPVDLHISRNAREWATLLVLRTGSPDYIMRLQQEAWDSRVIEFIDKDDRVGLLKKRKTFHQPTKESGIYRMLKIPMPSPEERV